MSGCACWGKKQKRTSQTETKRKFIPISVQSLPKLSPPIFRFHRIRFDLYFWRNNAWRPTWQLDLKTSTAQNPVISHPPCFLLKFNSYHSALSGNKEISSERREHDCTLDSAPINPRRSVHLVGLHWMVSSVCDFVRILKSGVKRRTRREMDFSRFARLQVWFYLWLL